jgi:hypothetical protein
MKLPGKATRSRKRGKMPHCTHWLFQARLAQIGSEALFVHVQLVEAIRERKSRVKS